MMHSLNIGGEMRYVEIRLCITNTVESVYHDTSGVDTLFVVTDLAARTFRYHCMQFSMPYTTNAAVIATITSLLMRLRGD